LIRGNAFAELSAQPELLDNRFVSFELILFQIVQKLAAAIRQGDQAVAAVKVLLVDAQVLRQMGDACRKKSDLDFGRPRVLVAEFVIADDFGFVVHDVRCFVFKADRFSERNSAHQSILSLWKRRLTERSRPTASALRGSHPAKLDVEGANFALLFAFPQAEKPHGESSKRDFLFQNNSS